MSNFTSDCSPISLIVEITLYTDMSDNPHTLIFHTFNIKYKNIDHVGFTNNDNKLMIVLPLKYSKEYKELV